MRALKGAAIIITLTILVYIIRQPALAYIFHHNEEVPTASDWQPKMRNWKLGEIIDGS